MSVDGELATIIVRAVIGVVITGLGFAMRGLFVRLREAESEIAVLKNQPAPTDKAGREAMEALQRFKLCVAESYIRRDDYVPQMALVTTKLDGIGGMVMRVDERTKLWGGRHES